MWLNNCAYLPQSSNYTVAQWWESSSCPNLLVNKSIYKKNSEREAWFSCCENQVMDYLERGKINPNSEKSIYSNKLHVKEIWNCRWMWMLLVLEQQKNQCGTFAINKLYFLHRAYSSSIETTLIQEITKTHCLLISQVEN